MSETTDHVDRIVADLTALDLSRAAHAASLAWAWAWDEVGVEDLKAARKQFAWDHHPDRTRGSHERIATANQLIDKALTEANGNHL